MTSSELKIRHVIRTFVCFIILALIWQKLELIIYGQIEPRMVDTIMSLIYLPFIYETMRDK